MSNNHVKAQQKYDAAHCTVMSIKLNNVYDKGIIDKLKSVSSKQGYIKQLIRRDIESNSSYEWDDKSDLETSGERTSKKLIDNSEHVMEKAEEKDYLQKISSSELRNDVSNREAFRKNLAELMRVAKVKQIDISKQIDVSYQTVSAWITGRAYPRADAMERLCQFFGIKQSALIENPGNEGTEEDALLAAFRVLSRQGREKLIERAEELVKLYPKKEDV